MQNSLRLFIALEITKDIHFQLGNLIFELQKLGVKTVKWVKAENIHLTLSFLGETPLTKLVTLQQALVEAIKKVDPFQMTVKGTGVFPSSKQPKVLWAGIGASDELHHLFDQVNLTIAGLGFPKDNHPFSPHLTLARVNSIENPLELDKLINQLFAAQNHEFGNMQVSAVTLFQSSLTSSGPVYSALARFPLAE
jgi:RNA 2',3'-cyclic 3'-phosphodiesterase